MAWLVLLGACGDAASEPNTYAGPASASGGVGGPAASGGGGLGIERSLGNSGAGGANAAAGAAGIAGANGSTQGGGAPAANGGPGADAGPLPTEAPDADTGDTPDADETPDAGAGADPGSDHGKGDGSDVITIGDSWMLLLPGLGIEVSLERAAMNDYRNYAVPGTRIDQIVTQYAEAERMGSKITTVVMTAGGNDILQDPAAMIDCPSLGMTCRMIVEGVLEKVNAMWDAMAEDGVKDVFIIEYSRPQLDALGLTPTLEYSTEITEKACAMAPLRCTTIDAAKIFGMREYISFDNIHPTEEGYELLGKATHEAMVRGGARR